MLACVMEGQSESIPETRGRRSDLHRVVALNEEIKQVVASAHRINLLALNATLTSKRAGDAARGFRQVALELRAFSAQLRDSMAALQSHTHGAVIAVSSLLRARRAEGIACRAADAAPDAAAGMLSRSGARTASCAAQLAAVDAALAVALHEVEQLALLGQVVARSAKIESAYGGTFASDLRQVAEEFSAVIDGAGAAVERMYRQTGGRGR